MGAVMYQRHKETKKLGRIALGPVALKQLQAYNRNKDANARAKRIIGAIGAVGVLCVIGYCVWLAV